MPTYGDPYRTGAATDRAPHPRRPRLRSRDASRPRTLRPPPAARGLSPEGAGILAPNATQAPGPRTMTEPAPVTTWVGLLKAGDPAAADALWRRYFTQLVGQAHRHLAGHVRRAADGE